MHTTQIRENVLDVELVLSGMRRKEYDVWLRSGNWLPDYQLMILCDGGDPEHPQAWEDRMFETGIVESTGDPNYKIVKLVV